MPWSVQFGEQLVAQPNTSHCSINLSSQNKTKQTRGCVVTLLMAGLQVILSLPASYVPSFNQNFRYENYTIILTSLQSMHIPPTGIFSLHSSYHTANYLQRNANESCEYYLILFSFSDWQKTSFPDRTYKWQNNENKEKRAKWKTESENLPALLLYGNTAFLSQPVQC